MARVVSETEKAGQTRQVSTGKTNESKPPMKCRKRRDVIETGLQLLVWDEARRKPVDCSSGDRHEGGVSPVQALVRKALRELSAGDQHQGSQEDPRDHL